MHLKYELVLHRISLMLCVLTMLSAVVVWKRLEWPIQVIIRRFETVKLVKI